jgi:glycosyltransferase involved in cell wall biosynthesis
MRQRISVIIPSYNSSQTIQYTLDGLLAQKGDWLKEIIVVDSSDDGKIDELIMRYKSKVIKFINSGVRVIPAKGRNIGASKAKGDLLVFLDADVIPVKDLLENIIAANGKGYKAGSGSVIMADFQGKNSIVVAQYYLQLSEYVPAGPERTMEFPVGCAVFCEKQIFFKSGGYPEIRAAEDVLLGQAINKITPIWFVPNVCVAHIFREELKGFLSNQRLLGKYAAIYRKKNSGSFFLNGGIVLVLFPLYYFYKLVLVMNRILHIGEGHFFKLAGVFPHFLLGVFFWTVGFTEGSREVG